MSVSIVATGDIVINNQLHRPTGDGTIYDRLRAADSCFANLEMPSIKDGHPTEKLIPLKCDPAHANVIHDIGVDVVTGANNHGMDFGLEGLRMTSRTLEDIGVAHVGVGEDITGANIDI